MRALACFLLLVVGLSLWAVLDERRGAPSPARAGFAESPDFATSGLVPPAGTVARSGVAPARTEAGAAPWPGELNPKVPPAHDPAKDDGTIVVVAIDPRPGTSLPGAVIQWLPAGRRSELVAAQPELAELELSELIEVWGRAAYADSDGRVVLPARDVLGGYVQARYADMYGAGRANPIESWLHLELIPERVLEVETVDADGSPRAAVPIQVIIRRDDIGSQELWRGHTLGPEGLAVSPRLPVRDFHVSGRDAGWRIFVAVADPLFGQERELDFDDWPKRVTLRMPPSGGIDVELCDDDGEPLQESVTVYVVPVSSGLRSSDALVRQATTDSARVQFDTLALGHVYDVQVSALGRSSSHTAARGPTVGGERVLVRACVGSNKPIVRCQLVDQSGRVLAGEVVVVQTSARGASGDLLSFGSQTVKSDASGNLQFVLAPTLHAGGDCELRFSIHAETTLTAEATLARPGGLGNIHLGRLVLTPVE